MKTDPVPRFWAKVKQSNGCWIWTASKTKDGYGTLRVGSRTVRAHRFSWELTNGPIPKGLGVLHRCDNPACVKPAHLFLGTHAENVQDCVSKGRARKARGRAHGRSVLTEQMVLQMRDIRQREGLSYAAIAKQFGVWPGTAYNAITGNRWNHI